MVIVDWIGLGQSASGLGWIGFSKMDQCPTLTDLLLMTAAGIVAGHCYKQIQLQRQTTNNDTSLTVYLTGCRQREYEYARKSESGA